MQNATTAVVTPSITDWYHRIEDVSMLAGKTITISFYARATIGTATLQLVVSQYNGTSYTDTAISEYPTFVAGNGWRRYSATLTLPAVSRSSISGINHHTNIILRHHHSVTTFGIWGFQVELGSVATPFSRAGGTLAGELAACQRYYWRTSTGGTYKGFGFGMGFSTTQARCMIQFPQTMRTTPSGVEYGGAIAVMDSVTGYLGTGMSIDGNVMTPQSAYVNVSVASGLTQYRPYFLYSMADANAYVGFSAEL